MQSADTKPMTCSYNGGLRAAFSANDMTTCWELPRSVIYIRRQKSVKLRNMSNTTTLHIKYHKWNPHTSLAHRWPGYITVKDSTRQNVNRCFMVMRSHSTTSYYTIWFAFMQSWLREVGGIQSYHLVWTTSARLGPQLGNSQSLIRHYKADASFTTCAHCCYAFRHPSPVHSYRAQWRHRKRADAQLERGEQGVLFSFCNHIHHSSYVGSFRVG